MRTCLKIGFALGATALLALAVTATGRVFLRLGGQEAAGLSPERLGWERAYRSNMEINGSAATVDVLLSDRGPRASLERLRALYEKSGGRAFTFCGDAMGWGMAITGDRVVRLLALSPERPSQAVVVRIEQSLEEPFRPRSLTPVPRRTGCAPYPGSEVAYAARDDEAGTAVEVSTAPAPPETVRAYYGTALRAAGWSAAAAERGGRPGGEVVLSLYVKGGSLCCVSVKSSGVREESVVTVLVKRLRDAGGSLVPDAARLNGVSSS